MWKVLEKTRKCHFEASDEGIWPRKSVEMMFDLKDQIDMAVTSWDATPCKISAQSDC